MSKRAQVLKQSIKEAGAVLLGSMIVLSISALILFLASPLKNEHYVYALLGSTFIGFIIWLAALCVFSRNTEIRQKVATAFAVLSTAMAFQLFVPMTVERSITVFLVQEMQAVPEGLSEQELNARFLTGYVEGRKMLQKRIGENRLNGNIEIKDNKVRLTSSGQKVAALLNFIGELFSVPRPPVSPKSLN